MKIKSVIFYMPATVSVELDNKEHDIFVMLHLASKSLFIPDVDEYKLIESFYDDFVDHVFKKLQSNEPVINVPQVPQSIFRRVVEARSSVAEKVSEIQQHADIERDADES